MSKQPNTVDRSTKWVTAQSLQKMHFKPISYLVRPYVVDGLTVLAGKPKVGKSWLAMDIALGVASGGEVLGGIACKQGSVLYAALEDPLRRVQDRLRKIAGTESWPEALTITTELAAIDAGGLDQLRRWLGAHPNPKLIVIDILGRVRPKQSLNEATYAYDYRSVAPLKALADEFGIALILVHHTRKQTASDPLEGVSGTNGLTGAADSILVLDRKGSRFTLYARGRDIPELDTALAFNSETFRWNPIASGSEVTRTSQRTRILACLEQSQSPLRSQEIASETGQSDDSVRQILGKMADAGEIKRVDRGLYTHNAHIDHNVTNTP
jgi:hypothetical protein